MAHFARVLGGTVVEVVVVKNDAIGSGDFPESEALGQAFLASLGLEGEWRQTSYSGSFRGTFAGVGYTYDPDLDVFTAPPTPDPEPLPEV